jgi:adenosylcobinamide kinase/adenosylcobinamide-phosphate guanylyltransferase
MSTTLVLGGARSGKSAFAEQCAGASDAEVVYIATARETGDKEMQARIAHHRSHRPAHWTTVEEPIALGAAIAHWRAPGRVVLVDCLTLWLSNLIFAGEAPFPDTGSIALPQQFHAQRAALLAALPHELGDVILVSNEVGMGIVPMGAVNRCFVDEAGRLNQAVAAICDKVTFVAAGLPLMLKGA